MATFEGKVTQDGWSVTFDTKPEDNQVSTTIAQALAFTFVQAQTSLQAEGQRFIRQTLEKGNTIPPAAEGFVNGFPHDDTEAENLTD